VYGLDYCIEREISNNSENKSVCPTTKVRHGYNSINTNNINTNTNTQNRAVHTHTHTSSFHIINHKMTGPTTPSTPSTATATVAATTRRPWQWRQQQQRRQRPNSKQHDDKSHDSESDDDHHHHQQQQQQQLLTRHNSNVTANTAAATTVANLRREEQGREQGREQGQEQEQEQEGHQSQDTRGLFSRLTVRLRTRRRRTSSKANDESGEEKNNQPPLHHHQQQQQHQHLQQTAGSNTNSAIINDVNDVAAAAAAAVVAGGSSADVDLAATGAVEKDDNTDEGFDDFETNEGGGPRRSSTEWRKVTLPSSSSPSSFASRATEETKTSSDHRDTTTFPVGAYPSPSSNLQHSSSTSSASGLRQRIHRWSRVNDVDSNTSRAGGPLGSRFESGSAASSNLSMLKQIHLHHHIQQQQQQQQQQLINSRASIDSTSMLSTVSSLTASQRQSSGSFLNGFVTQEGTGDGRRRGSSAPLTSTPSSSSFRRFSSRRLRMMKKSGSSSRAASSRSFTNTAIQRYHDATANDHDFDADEEKTTCTSSRFFATASDLNTYGNCGPGASGEFKIYVEVDSVSIVDNANQHGVYTGTLDRLNHKPHGIGTMIYSQETLVYDGQWVKGDWCGFGSLIDTKNGHTYQGGFFDNYKHGLGVLTYADGRIYECSFTLGTMELKGHLEYPDGTKYWGHWTAEGIEHGRGKKEYVDGRVFDGEFSKGIIHGHGRMTYPDGSWYLGEWMDGEQNGLGMHVKADGTLLCEGTFCHGKPIEGSSCPSTSLKSEGDFLLYRSSVAPHGTLVGNIPQEVVMRPEKWII